MKNDRILKIIVWGTVAGVVLISSLVVTGLTLRSRSETLQASELEPIGIESMMSLSPTYGGANTLVNLTGIGFPENARVRLYLTSVMRGQSATPQAETLTDDIGRFSVMLQLAGTWPDGTPITDEQLTLLAISEDNSMHASAVFAYIPPVIQPEITLTPTSGGAGTPVTVTSVGFPVGSRVQLKLGPPEGGYGPQAYGEGIADSNGSVTVNFAMPDNWPDGSRVKEEQLEVVAITEDGAVRATSGFDYVPVPHPLMAITPNFGGPDTPVSITGDGYPAGVRVLIKIGTSVDDAAARPAYFETMADTRGNINVPWVMPAGWTNGLPILTRDVVVLATAADRSGFGWMGFAYLDFAPVEALAGDTDLESEEGDEPANEDASQVAPVVPSPETPETVQAPAGEVVVETVTPDEVVDEPGNPIVPQILVVPSDLTPEAQITINGAGFPAGATVTIRLGLTPDAPDAALLGEGLVDEDGNFVLAFIMPATWFDGTAIEQPEVYVIVATADASTTASTLLTFTPAAQAE